MYLNISGASAVNTVESSPQILWYPNKQAFLAGNVHIGLPDSVGTNSTALGYKSIAMGDFSQALGYKTKAFGDYSTAIGKMSVAGARSEGVSTSSSAFALGNGAQATGDDSYAFGSGAKASGTKSFAFGSVGVDASTGNPTSTPTQATEAYSIAFGMGAQATSKGALALGVGSLSSGYLSSSLGYMPVASGSYSLSLGYSSDATGTYSVAIGFNAQSTNLATTAIGYNAIASNQYATAIGTNASAQASNSYAFGTDANASLDNAYAIGKGAISSGNTSMSIGSLSQATAQNAVAFGNNNVSSGSYSVTLGNSNTSGTAAYAVALGNSNLSSGSSSIAFGNSNSSSGSSSVAIGNNSTSSSTFSTAIGYYAQATGIKSVSVGANYYKTIFIKPLIPIIRPIFFLPKGGVISDPSQIPLSGGGTKGGFIILPTSINRNNIAEGEYSLAVGNGNWASNGGNAFGVYNDATAQFATAVGFGNHASAVNSFAAGYANETTGEFSTAFGRYTNATSENSFVIGRYNVSVGTTTDWVETEPLFQIGNGSSSSATNDAFRVLKNGGTYINSTNAYAGLSVVNNNTSNNPNTTYALGIMSGIQRNKAGLNYYSGYFYDAGGGQGTYWGLFADTRSGAAIDLAEYIYDTQANTEAADVVVADALNKESVIKSSKPYQTAVVGVISTKPHMTMGMELLVDEKTGEPLKNAKPSTRLALTGRVPVKVTNENGAIVAGDLLTTSSTPGHAMKWSLLDVTKAKDFEELKTILAENERRRNAIIGKALESHTGGTGKIMVLISLQ
jgi:Head domain of trimeric autotransporter adhesin